MKKSLYLLLFSVFALVFQAPAQITGTPTVCAGATTTLSDATVGGSWSSSNTAIAKVGSGTGIVVGVSAGTATITYTSGISSDLMTVTVNPLPAAIAGVAFFKCPGGGNTTYSDITTGGTWTDSNPGVAAIDPSTGILTPLAIGLITITYRLPTGCFITKPAQNLLPTISITGADPMCVGDTSTYTWFPECTWSTSIPATATIGSSSGLVTGISAGTTIIRGSMGLGCTMSRVVTVNVVPLPGIISGPAGVCIGRTITLTDGISGGIWSAANATATVSGGAVTGVSGGADTISYTVTNSCGTAVATKAITVNLLPSAGTVTGDSTVCVGATTTLTDGVSGGTWSRTNATATVSGGTVTGVSAGADTIKYTVVNSCGTAVATETVTINPLPNAGTITGASTVCAGASITLTDVVTDGVWGSSNGTATVSGGVVTGISAGADTISYSVSNSCGMAAVTRAVTINPLPVRGTIAGAVSVCVGATISLTDAAPGGVWSSSDPLIAAIGSGTGIVTGIATDSVVLSYTVITSCGTAIALDTIAVSGLPDAGAITGASALCVGATILLADTVTITSGVGRWSSRNPSATVAAGVVTGITGGVDTISYAVTNTCGTATAIKTITINALPDAGVITGPPGVCVGSSVTLADPAPGGMWYSSSALNATVSSTGNVTGLLPGSSTISYVVANLCGADTAIKSESVDVPVLPIVGPSVVCLYNFITLTDGSTGGSWSSSSVLVAPVVAGVVIGVSAGAATITYSLTNGCGTTTATQDVSVISCTLDEQTVDGTKEELLVYPNPNEGAFMLKGTFAGPSAQDAMIEIRNVVGQVVYNRNVIVKNGKMNEYIEPGNIAAGVYALSVKTEMGSKVIKFVKE